MYCPTVWTSCRLARINVHKRTKHQNLAPKYVERLYRGQAGVQRTATVDHVEALELVVAVEIRVDFVDGLAVDAAYVGLGEQLLFFHCQEEE